MINGVCKLLREACTYLIHSYDISRRRSCLGFILVSEIKTKLDPNPWNCINYVANPTVANILDRPGR